MKDTLKEFIDDCISTVLYEGMRIQHIEDLIFWEGSKGALRAVKGILDLEKEGYKNVTIKWDGSPTVVFGRNERGEFIFTNKAGFFAKGYDGKAKSGKELEQMFLNMGKVPANEKSAEYKEFASNMGNVFQYFQKSTPIDFRGYFTGDMLFSKTPNVIDGKFTFKPGIVTYKVDANSDIGSQIAKSKCGIVVHRQWDVNGENEIPAKDVGILKKDMGLFVVPPVTVQSPPNLNKDLIKDILKLIKSNGKSIDSLLDHNTLSNMKLTNFPDILYTYMNSKVDSGLENLGKDFINWLTTNDKISDSKKRKIVEYIKENISGFNSIWEIVSKIMDVKESIIDQFENQKSPISATIGDTYKGGEGYVLSHPSGDMKFVSRPRFTAASRLAHKKDPITEGGNVFDATIRISKSDVMTTIKWLESITHLPLVNNLLGTAGKVDTSGDLDLAVDETKTTKDGLYGTLQKWCVENKLDPKLFIKKTGDSVHFKTPINGDLNNGFVQTDFMFGDPSWMIWSLRGGKPGSKFKGMHRHVLMASIAKFRNMKWSYKNGLVDRNTNVTITKDPDQISKLLLGDDASASDLDSFESILYKIQNDKDYEKMTSDAKTTLLKYGVKF